MPDPNTRHQLLRAILRLIFVAAVASAPVFLIAESFEPERVMIIIASNGVCAALCLVLLHRLRKGKYESGAQVLVFGLLGLVAWLASTNGESVHVNVVNFVLVTVLASVLLGARSLWFVAAVSALSMILIAWRQAAPTEDEGVVQIRMELIGQFLPTYLVVVTILWLSGRRGGTRES